MKKLITYAVFLAAFATTSVKAQNSPDLKTLMPASPNAAALGKYGEIPVSLYSGIADIHIPLYTLKSRELEVPITLNYHAGGIRLEEIASWVGIGWSLNAGGVITRTVRGMPDDAVGGYFGAYANINRLAKYYFDNPSQTNTYLTGGGNALANDLPLLLSSAGQTVDAEPDIFYFNFGKYSGKFFMNEHGQFVASPLEALRISYDLNQANSGRAARWTITTPDGVKYIFGYSLNGQSTAIENNNNDAPYVFATTAWYLVEIDSPNNDVITFHYSNVNYNYSFRCGEVLNTIVYDENGGAGGIPIKENKITTNYMTAPRLMSITGANGSVNFTTTGNRTDLPGEAPLTAINIFSSKDPVNPFKSWQLAYDYSTGRLTLEGLTEKTPAGLNAGHYSFQYTGSLPINNPASMSMNSQDLWGYYNGAMNTVLPQGAIVVTPTYGTISVAGADRHTDENAMLSGMLTKISYPTGGYSQFDYEANRIFTNVLDNSIPPPPAGKGAAINFQTGQTQTQVFTVEYPDPNSHVVSVSATAHAMKACLLDPVGYPQCYTATIVGINGTEYGPYTFKDGLSNFTLSPGTYQITGSSPQDIRQVDNVYHLSLSWLEFPPPPPVEDEMADKLVGGLRIKRITNFDGITSTVKHYLYDQFGETNQSSGVLVNMPSNNSTIYRQYVDDGSLASVLQFPFTDYMQVRSYPVVPLMPTQGSPIGYTNVTELQGENGENGKTEYTFTTANDYGDVIFPYLPYPPACSFDWRRGLPLTTKTYKNVDGDFVAVQSKTNEYVTEVNQSVGYGYTVECDVRVRGVGTVDFEDENSYVTAQADHGCYYVGGYKTVSEFYYLSADHTTYYDEFDPELTLETSNYYSYDVTNGHYQLIQMSTTDSKGQSVVTNYTYPPDDVILSGEAESARQAMVSKFIISPVLEKQVLVNGDQTFDTKNNFKNLANGLTMPDNIVMQVGDNDPEARVQFGDYDNYGNLLSQRKVYDLNNSYIWDYHSAYPIAEVKNADVVDIAYTSFEADGTGNWVESGTGIVAGGVTGTNAYELGSGSITTQNSLNTDKNYIISMWAQSMPSVPNATFLRKGRTYNGFTYYEFKTSDGPSSVTVSGSGLIDELRLYPTDAQMSTCTYRPLFGISSRADISSKIAYYEYDGLGRLQLIRDQDNNIVKRFEYQYQQP